MNSTSSSSSWPRKVSPKGYFICFRLLDECLCFENVYVCTIIQKVLSHHGHMDTYVQKANHLTHLHNIVTYLVYYIPIFPLFAHSCSYCRPNHAIEGWIQTMSHECVTPTITPFMTWVGISICHRN